ncbi:unnamed protein product [Rhodiola kirilowii]
MSPETTWLIKLKTAIYHKSNPSHVLLGVLSFEASSLMAKLLHIHHYLSDQNMTTLRNHSIRLEGLRKIVSNDDVFLLGLACAEIVDSLKSISNSIARFGSNCRDPNLQSFHHFLHQFAETGNDLNNWILSGKEMDARVKQMDRYVDATATLRKQIDQLAQLEAGLRKSVKLSGSKRDEQNVVEELQQKISWQKKQIKYQKERSLWNKSFDSVTLTLARFSFTILSRIKLVFGIGHARPITSLPRSLSASAAVCPSSPISAISRRESFTKDTSFTKDCGFFEMNSRMLKPPSTTLGTAGLALHYSNLIIVMEKMIRSPHLVGMDARDDLYAMLPQSIRSSLRSRLKGIGFAASDPVLGAEWSDALGRILGWLCPLAVNMIKWQGERSFEQHNNNNQVQKTNVLLFQTLYFANKEKAEAAITELLVGLNYIWRFEREVNAKSFCCTNAQTSS